MHYNCFLCNKKLDHKVTWDIRYAFKRFPYGKFDNKDFDLFNPEKNSFFCVDCGVNYYKLKSQKKGINKIINGRSITGKLNLDKIPIKIKDQSEYCSFCNEKVNGINISTPIHFRNYIEGLGTLCHKCYKNC
tara:strand:- start:1193 stop:1588 length:396 start_codon:yes stop_codon:yes gene_type:complete